MEAVTQEVLPCDNDECRNIRNHHTIQHGRSGFVGINSGPDDKMPLLSVCLPTKDKLNDCSAMQVSMAIFLSSGVNVNQVQFKSQLTIKEKMESFKPYQEYTKPPTLVLLSLIFFSIHPHILENNLLQSIELIAWQRETTNNN
eukprot:5327466-Ditylum_brightwellii.AAC.1